VKTKSLTIRLSERRRYKLELYAAQNDRTITSLIEEWIDNLKLKENSESG